MLPYLGKVNLIFKFNIFNLIILIIIVGIKIEI